MARQGAAEDPRAAANLLALVYDELRRLASARLADKPSGNTLQPTAFVQEADLRLVAAPVGDHWNHRGGSDRYDAAFSRAGHRGAHPPSYQSIDQGLRLARVPSM